MVRHLKFPLLAALCALAFAVAACGDDDGGSKSSSGGGSNDGNGSVAAETQTAIDAGFKGTFTAPPKTSPHPQAGKNIWFIPISSSTYDYRRPGSLYDAAKKMGWKITQFDGKFSPDTIVNGIRQAIADKADGIILYIIDCSNVKAALEEADKAGIPVVAAQGFDCNEVKGGGRALFDATVHYTGAEDPNRPMPFVDFIRDEWGKTQALAVINGTKGKAKIIDVYESDLLVTVEQDKGVRAALKKYCADCEVVETVEFPGSEIGAPLQQKIEQALTRHPDANAIISPYDAVTKITAAAVRESGRTDIYSVGAEGEANVMDGIRTGGKGVSAAVGLAPDWELHSMLDAMNRVLAGEKEGDGFPTGNGTQIIDKTHNLPPKAGQRYQPPLDFRTAYYDAWGVR